MKERKNEKTTCISGKNISNAFLSMVLFMVVMGTVIIPAKSQGIEFKRTSEAVQIFSELGALLNDLHPTLYLNNGEIKKFGNKPPLIIECNAESTPLLAKENPDYAHVELIRVNIESLSAKPEIDLSLLKSFQNLKYIQLLFTYDVCGQHSDNCLPIITKDIVTGTESENVITILYSLSIPN